MLALPALLFAGCERNPAPVSAPARAGADLERVAVARGLIADPSAVQPVGVYATDEDRVCIVADGGGYRIGAAVDLGPEHRCVAHGAARGRTILAVDFGEGCALEVAADGERVAFPAILPAACDRLCSGRASLSALSVPRLSASPEEATATRGPGGAALCG